ncbi:hypothetical protein TSO221_28695 [Azospirillum sp. TSO22-1]|nr:hypothetical protein TSO221_28695 [Azospirillum sp. TSO22-1]
MTARVGDVVPGPFLVTVHRCVCPYETVVARGADTGIDVLLGVCHSARKVVLQILIHLRASIPGIDRLRHTIWLGHIIAPAVEVIIIAILFIPHRQLFGGGKGLPLQEILSVDRLSRLVAIVQIDVLAFLIDPHLIDDNRLLYRG